MSAINGNGVVSAGNLGVIGVGSQDVGHSNVAAPKTNSNDPPGSVPEITAVQGIVPTLQSV
jgi:hypothetical protein